MITVLFALLSALYDNGKRFTDHTSRFVFRAIILCLISVVEVPIMLVGIWIPTVIQILLNIFIFYGVFDYALNILEGRKWNYIGTTSVLDKLTNKYGNWKIQFIIKILLVAVTFTLKLKII